MVWEVRTEDSETPVLQLKKWKQQKKGRQAAAESFKRKGKEKRSLESTADFFHKEGEPYRKRESGFSQASSDISVGVLLTDSQMVSFRRSSQSPPFPEVMPQVQAFKNLARVSSLSPCHSSSLLNDMPHEGQAFSHKPWRRVCSSGHWVNTPLSPFG